MYGSDRLGSRISSQQNLAYGSFERGATRRDGSFERRKYKLRSDAVPLTALSEEGSPVLFPSVDKVGKRKNMYLGFKRYELKNHLGNVMATITDRKQSVHIQAVPLVIGDFTRVLSHYQPEVVSISDYYPFGSGLPNRQFSSNGYRYGFNGKEKDDEWKGSGVSYDYGFRIYDTRLGKFLSVDPLTKSYPWYTPYQFAGNMPIEAIDLDGLEEFHTQRDDDLTPYTDAEYAESSFSNLLYNIYAFGYNNLAKPLYNGSSWVINKTYRTFKDPSKSLEDSENAIKQTVSNTAKVAEDMVTTPITGEGIVNVLSDPKSWEGPVSMFMGGAWAKYLAKGKPSIKVSNAARSSNVGKTIHSGAQGKHMPGHNNYVPAKNRSILKSDAQNLLDDFHSGNIKSSQTINDVKTRVDFGKEIGTYINKETGVSVPTTKGIIHTGKNGAHIVPSAPK